MGNRRPKKSQKTIALQSGDCALIFIYRLNHVREGAVDDFSPIFGIHLGCGARRSNDIAKQDCDYPPLAFHHPALAGRFNFLEQFFGNIPLQQVSSWSRRSCILVGNRLWQGALTSLDRTPAVVAEFCPLLELGTTAVALS
jgi:hypothetical protein